MPDAARPYRLNRLAFVAWSWAILLVILVSAAPDGGAPGSRALGSAFDPATVSVTVGPQQPRVVAAAEIDEVAPPAFSGSADQVAVLEFALSGAVAGGSFAAYRPMGIADPRSLTRAHGARAPPIA